MRRSIRNQILRAAALVATVAQIAGVVAQTAGDVPLPGVARDAALGELSKECFEAGMTAEMPNDSVIDCSAILEQRSTRTAELEPGEVDETLVTVRHKLRFTLTESDGGLRIAADAWVETEELGTAFEEPLTSEDYLERVQAVLVDVGRRLRAAADTAPPWDGRYEGELAWHRDAHLHAVAHCDAQLASMTADALAAQLVSIGLRPLSADTRDRCEQLYQFLFEWGLARGNSEPSPEAYARYRASLPPDLRACSGRLALETSCP